MYFSSEYSIYLTHNTDSLSIHTNNIERFFEILMKARMSKETFNIQEINHLSRTLNLDNHINENQVI